jgi:hypothetical protein
MAIEEAEEMKLLLHGSSGGWLHCWKRAVLGFFRSVEEGVGSGIEVEWDACSAGCFLFKGIAASGSQ